LDARSDILVGLSSVMSTKPHFSILATSFAGGPRPRNAAFILLSLWVAVFFCSLFAPPVLDDADATHAQAARAVAMTGDLVTLKVDGVRYLEKAPLPYWIEAASFRVFGYNTFAAHLPQAVTVLLLMLLGHRWANQAFGSRTGFYAAIGILTSVGVFLFTRFSIPDALLSLLLGAALFAFLKSLGPVAVEQPRNSAEADVKVGEVQERPSVVTDAGPMVYPYVMWSVLALAVLTKGLVALVFFFGTALAYLVLTDDWRKWKLLRPFSGGLLFLAIAAPWHVLAGLRNQGGMDGHGFWWFYFWNEHVLRFLGRRVPQDYNKLPGWVYWGMHLVWLFPWTLFLPLGVAAVWRRFRHQTYTLTRNSNLLPPLPILLPLMLLVGVLVLARASITSTIIVAGGVYIVLLIGFHRMQTGFEASPFHRIDPQQRTILLLSLFAGIVLLFFSLSTNQEYYTFPAYLPILLLIAATITRAEQTYAFDPAARRWVTFAHAAFAGIGACVAVALLAALWASRSRPYMANLGDVLAHRGVGDYTLSMSHLFDLTADAFAGLRLPAVLAAGAFASGPALAWMLRAQRRHLAATTTVAWTAGMFLVAAHVAFARFGPMLSSEDFAARIQAMEGQGVIARDSQVLLYGDQAYGSSIPFYLGEPVKLVEGRSTSMLFGSSYADVPKVFETRKEMLDDWGTGERKVLFVPLERRDEVDELLKGRPQVVIAASSGKALITDRELDRR
jgi:4-amino-4-deoxy-L-arabinose transferase-like glycosyltransferase